MWEAAAFAWCFSDNKPPVQLGVDKKALAKERTSCGKMRAVWQPQSNKAGGSVKR